MEIKYKVLKEFGCAKKGDILTNSADDPSVFTLEVAEDGNYRWMSLSDDLADAYCEDEYLECCMYTAEDTIRRTVEFIDELLEKYADNLTKVNKEADKGNVQPCVKVEAQTVYYNLTKVLTAIKKALNNEEYEQIG